MFALRSYIELVVSSKRVRERRDDAKVRDAGSQLLMASFCDRALGCRNDADRGARRRAEVSYREVSHSSMNTSARAYGEATTRSDGRRRKPIAS